MTISVHSYWLQNPESFDFEITRAINAPAAHLKHVEEPMASGKKDSLDEKTSGMPAAEVQSVSDQDGAIGVTDDSELDRAGLQSAFKFAAWSSVLLVCREMIASPYDIHNLPTYLHFMQICACRTAVNNDHHHSIAALLRPNHLWRTRVGGVGRDRHHLGVLFGANCRGLPVVREP